MTGIKGVAEALRLEIFPMDIHGVDYAVGDMTIESPSGEQLFVRDISDQFTQNEFRTPESVVAEILRVIEARPESRIHRKPVA